MRAALHAARLRKPHSLIMAVPVAPRSIFDDFRGEADQIVCLATPEPFGAVGYFYQNFEPTTDTEVIQLMRERRLEDAGTEG